MPCAAPGDRSHISPTAMPIYEILKNEMQRIKSRAPANYRPQVLDTEKRINILFDHLNSQDIKPDTVEEVKELAQAIQSRQHDQATAQLTELMTTKTDEGSHWMVRVN
jgi:protein transport protein SEC31